MIKLFRTKAFLVTLCIFVVVLGGLIIAWQSALYTLNHMNFRVVTPTQLAASMRQDQFWSNYRFNTLVFQGEVKKVSNQDGTTKVSFKTSDPYSLNCEMRVLSNKLKVGAIYTFEAETYQAERQPAGVLLHNCINL